MQENEPQNDLEKKIIELNNRLEKERFRAHKEHVIAVKAQKRIEELEDKLDLLKLECELLKRERGQRGVIILIRHIKDGLKRLAFGNTVDFMFFIIVVLAIVSIISTLIVSMMETFGIMGKVSFVGFAFIGLVGMFGISAIFAVGLMFSKNDID